MLSGNFVLNVLVVSFFETVGQVFVKTYYEENDKKLYLFFLGWLMYLGVVYFLLRAYDDGNFAITNAFWNALTTVSISLIGIFYYKENLTKAEMVGIGLIVLGFLVIGIFSNGGK